ncbi:TonB-dependent receptor [Povalibacter sp.]|uniref:TonB-dependent receptor n=1 Tax=Povalibacter sp. TaxID=1962978 RepID=UPI002F3E8C63
MAIAAILAAGPVAHVYAQEKTSPSSGALEEVIVTGLRGSLEASMDIKRDAIGVVDAISAEDIGKFPDTNLAESLQRITGVSIDRRNGEGAVVTARGFGPEFNLVTLNGRQMPTADAYANGAVLAGGVGAGNRSFNFANLSADGISGLEVYKTGKADMATGGIGATVNVKTFRPFDNDGMLLNLGAKGIYDTNVDAGDEITPELSGIFSYANDDQTWGVSLNASYQKRDSSAAGSSVNDWHIQPWRTNLADNRSSAPLFVNNNGTVYGSTAGADDFVQATIVNAPKEGQLYGIPNDIRYHYSDRESERSNGQLTVQFAPSDSMTLTADYTYALQELKEDRGDQTTWLQRNGFYYMEFDTDEAVATPVLLKEHTGSAKDFGYEQQHREQKNDLSSFGFNMNWAVSDRISVDIDFHDSKARSLPNDPITGGGETTFSVAGKTRGNCLAFYPGAADFDATPICQNSENAWDQVFAFNNGLPIAGRTLFADTNAMLAGTGGNDNVAFNDQSMGTQVLRVNYQGQETTIQQFRAGSTLDFDEGRFQFGLETRDMEMHSRSSGGYMALGDWGVGDAGTVPDMVALMRQYSLTGGFDDYSTAGAPSGGWKGNANELAQWAFANGYGDWSEEAAPDGQLRYNPGFGTNDIVEEKTTAFYAQLAFHADVGTRAANLLVGARYEATDVTATSRMLPTKYLTWMDDNDFQQTQSGSVADTVTRTETANYTNVLPNLDFDIEVFDSLKARVSYSKTIARANYGQLTAAVDANTPGGSSLNGFQATGTANNPGLLPLESTNLDFSLEWYFSDNGYVSVGWFDKDIVNFIGQGVFNEPLVGLGGGNIKDQTGGPRAQAALAALGGAADDSALFTMMAMMEHPDGFTDGDGVFWAGGSGSYNGTNEQHVAWATEFDLVTRADDPDYIFAVQKPINNKEANIHGWEFGGQYFFGGSGFGVLANYTIVKGDVGFDNAGDPNVNQFALLGLSDSANAVLMYEKYGISARIAYNWRDEFLTQANQGQWRNPFYVDEYYQIDASVGYTLNEHLSFVLEGVNLTGEDVRLHGRSSKQLVRLEDQSARYAIGARYKF